MRQRQGRTEGAADKQLRRGGERRDDAGDGRVHHAAHDKDQHQHQPYTGDYADVEGRRGQPLGRPRARCRRFHRQAFQHGRTAHEHRERHRQRAPPAGQVLGHATAYGDGGGKASEGQRRGIDGARHESNQQEHGQQRFQCRHAHRRGRHQPCPVAPQDERHHRNPRKRVYPQHPSGASRPPAERTENQHHASGLYRWVQQPGPFLDRIP